MLPRMRAWRFSSAAPDCVSANASVEHRRGTPRTPARSGCVSMRMPRRSASACASALLPSDEKRDGIDDADDVLGAERVDGNRRDERESMPPDSPISTTSRSRSCGRSRACRARAPPRPRRRSRAARRSDAADGPRRARSQRTLATRRSAGRRPASASRRSLRRRGSCSRVCSTRSRSMSTTSSSSSNCAAARDELAALVEDHAVRRRRPARPGRRPCSRSRRRRRCRPRASRSCVSRNAPLPRVVRRAVDVDDDLGAGAAPARASGPSGYQMSSQMFTPTSTPAIVEHGRLVPALEVALLVEDAVVRQELLVVDAAPACRR